MNFIKTHNKSIELLSFLKIPHHFKSNFIKNGTPKPRILILKPEDLAYDFKNKHINEIEIFLFQGGMKRDPKYFDIVLFLDDRNISEGVYCKLLKNRYGNERGTIYRGE
jgi:hypothetical protein